MNCRNSFFLAVAAAVCSGRTAFPQVRVSQPTTAPTTLTAATGTTVQEAQKRLRALGYAPGSADGVIGSRTLVALKKFQTDQGVSATGVLDDKTLSALGIKKEQESTTKTSTASIQEAQSEEYHKVDPAKAGFKLVFKVSSFARDALGRILYVDVTEASIDDQPSPLVGGNLYPLELESKRMTDGTIHTTQFGDIRVSAEDDNFYWEMMMTDSQVKKLQSFLKASAVPTKPLDR